ncbi:hypothetical protein PR202_ga02505 [Eleusine coracana subsp. coracana]|uniref:hydroxymethylglutaryl-CoA reductase (NADPH) n=1 Tax=Eleusine coracana subsp. coracana TaxID=191504 RepID=A0AAV5BLW2_ELECO|nr:hypothetical protein PR202_ga02505 [Eleusine coracana subsp. coracana]
MPLPVRITNGLAMISLVLSSCDLLRLCSDPDRALRFPLGGREAATVLCQLASVVYLLCLLGVPFAHPSSEPRPAASPRRRAPPQPMHDAAEVGDEEIVAAVVSGALPSYRLESRLGNCRRAARLRREALRRVTGRGVEGLPFEGMDYQAILGQCCEMPVGFVQLPVGVAGPLLLDGRQYYVPMATTEGCLVASVNRGCRAIAESGGAVSVLLRDAMSRAPAVKLPSARRAAELKAFVEEPANFDTLAPVFDRSSRFGRLQGIHCALAGRNLYMRFTCSTGDAMGMNMVSKGVENVLDYLRNDFPDMDLVSLSGQDPAQNVESSQCITMLEAVNEGRDLHVSVTMPSIEVGTIGGGTCLASQAACLNLLGVKGPNHDSPGANAKLLATIVAGSVLAGELSLLAALAAGQLVKSHMKYNRSSKDVTSSAAS